MSAHNEISGKPFTFHRSHQGEQLLDLDVRLLEQGECISAREGYSLQETQFLKYLASKGHLGGTA